ncbi:hypothetical protein GBA52_027020 [Prunus armeniaca]|nr:hypothetical protein GBA52_027020 [Prunus armeniaca]
MRKCAFICKYLSDNLPHAPTNYNLSQNRTRPKREAPIRGKSRPKLGIWTHTESKLMTMRKFAEIIVKGRFGIHIQSYAVLLDGLFKNQHVDMEIEFFRELEMQDVGSHGHCDFRYSYRSCWVHLTTLVCTSSENISQLNPADMDW